MWRDDLAMARRRLLPVWGPMPLRAITRAHVHERLDTLLLGQRLPLLRTWTNRVPPLQRLHSSNSLSFAVTASSTRRKRVCAGA